ncbi:IS4 family transposase [Vibrio campbellii]|uniref:Transposase IS4-like domain-containing protein n=1 Tax=Vibrio campbellii (strain ATCC BAA-1116) TaxID=2902295 RepID=A7MVU5_VIBC1|nr:IS4 family transposase [Vibrio campbellii]ABU71116.1 hypothetical protein VIBHAR_02151 [Vibrio campbellii ATCC BAA-1116]
MNLSTILNTFFLMSSFSAIKDKRRITAVLDCINALNEKDTLTLTGLGRGMKNTKTKVKHCIKRVCRLLGNPHLHRERTGVYAYITDFLLKNVKHPIIIVDWSPVNHVDKQILRATIPIGGRAFTLYEEVHPECKLGSLAVHKAFIRRLATMVPKGVIPIVTTDAGFKVPWFKPIEQQGWYWLGRVRGNSKLRVNDRWCSADEVFVQAQYKPQHLGTAELTKQHQYPCQVCLYRKKSKGRKAKNWSGSLQRNTVSLSHAKGEREPWLLVSNLPGETWFAERVIALYTQRMSIEEGFRDTKNERYGLALNFSGSASPKRIEILLMIGMLTQFALLVVGKVAYLKGYYKDFQANTIRTRRVLSYFFLGKELIGREAYSFSVKDLALAVGGLKAISAAEFR